ncbi:hypothetical protein [Pedobacter sp. FW305-3-2-15-E-R2A2]|uniref:hypothetical protein n=1 Tax=Pedobacter sp. FW305-3-2-15-E-R2A2 TaxID=3140251 RepID=UPI0031403F3F
MNSFEDIQNNWLSQQVIEELKITDIQSAQNKWQKHQHKLWISNVVMSICFLLTFSVIGWIYLSFQNKYRWPFDLSIAAISSLMILALIVAWKSYSFKTQDLGVSSIEYLQHQVKKLEWQRKTLTIYIWIYNLLLWLAITMYIIEITRRGTLLFTLTAIGVNTLYVVGFSLWSKYYKNKKKIQAIDTMLAELKQGIEDISL